MRILVLAGGFDQIALIQELKKRGHEVLLADYYQNPPAKKVADQHFSVSTLDENAILELAKKEKVDMVTTACTDQALLTVAKVSEILGLPCYISYDVAKNVTNKSYMKSVFEKNHIPSAKYMIVEKLEDIDLSGFSFPLVIKPVDSGSSKGVVKAHGVDELEGKFQESVKESRSKYTIIEEFKQGKEISVDAFIRDGKVDILCMRELIKIRSEDNFTIIQGVCPPIIKVEIEEKIKLEAQKIASAFQLFNSPLLIQLMVVENEIFILEFSARMGGGSKYKTIELLTGINIMEKYVDLILGNEVVYTLSDSKKIAHMNFCYAENGVIERIVGLDELKMDGVIDESFIYKSKGMRIEKHTTSTDRVLGYFISGKTADEVFEKEQKANSQIKIIDGQGKDIFARSLFGEIRK